MLFYKSKPQLLQGNFPGLDYSIDHHHHEQHTMRPRIGETSGENSNQMVDYMLNNPQQPHVASGFCSSTSPEKLSFADVMQFADFGPKLALNQARITEEEPGIDPGYFLRFPVLNDNLGGAEKEDHGVGESKARAVQEEDREGEIEGRGSENASMQLGIVGENLPKSVDSEGKNKRKRARTLKTSEEVESQRMIHIAVERNRRKQMNEHLRVLRSLMPGSYVQRGDQASIIGGAIEFVRELEQLLQCLESQKRRRLYGDPPRAMGAGGESSLAIPPQPNPQPTFFPPNEYQLKLAEYEAGLREETAESKSCLADVEVKMLGFDAMIKILSRRRPGQLIKTIAGLEELQLNILHTNITTIEQTVLYSFNVKVASEARFTAEDIANSVQQIFSFIHANSTI
ncbi:hypothetical protein NMG60_11017402 [Bertholletia excelsa]